MRRLLLTLLWFQIAVLGFAQTQSGYVKTLGRPEQAGRPLGGVSVRAQGQHNVVVSNDNGLFSLQMPDKKNGDVYILQQVQKNGYVLNESDLIGRKLAFSDRVPLTIVMASSEQLQADRQRIEDNAFKAAERNFNAQKALLEQQLNDSTISAQVYRAEMESLQEKFEKYQSLINGLAEHYAHTDYDLLDEKDREINLCIENGELERADSLIHLLFNPLGVLERNKEALAKLDWQIEQAQGIIDQANADLAAVLKQQEKDAEYLYQLYTIALSRYDNEKALFYIETRATLDTTFYKWQLQAGSFIRDYLADYDRALVYFKRALNASQLMYGENSAGEAFSYDNIGSIYQMKGNYKQALDYFTQSLNIWMLIDTINQREVANSYINLGSTYQTLGEDDKALEYLFKALDIELPIFGENHEEISIIYDNIGLSFSNQGDYEKALEYHLKALKIRQTIYGENHPYMAYSYHNISLEFLNQGNFDKALEYSSQAVDIWIRSFGENHPNLAYTYNLLGKIYSDQGNWEKALEYFNMALNIRLSVLGEDHLETSINYWNIGSVYREQGDYEKAIPFFLKTLKTWQSVYGKDHPNLAKCLNDLGSAYSKTGEYDKAMDYYTDFLNIQKATFGENSLEAAQSYNNIAYVYSLKGDDAKNLEYSQIVLGILESIYGPDHPDTKSVQKRVNDLQSKIKAGK